MPRGKQAAWIAMIAVASYGLTLVVSSRVRHRETERLSSGPDPSVTLQAIRNDRQIPMQVRMSYRDLRPRSEAVRHPVLLIHGSPGHKEDFNRLADTLSRDARVIVPDLPGFGASTRNLPDYSFRAHARYLDAFLDGLGVSQVHVLAYSMGGGVALNVIDINPARAASLTMLSAIGAQEFELTGDYYANHILHGAQLAALWLLLEGSPHLGLLDHQPLNLSYARNFFDSDQRPLRNVLSHVDVPVLAIHGRHDPQVPVDAAMEHARLMPQSELVLLDGGHMLAYSDAGVVGTTVRRFLERTEQGEALNRDEADPERRADAERPFDVTALPRVRGIAAVVCAGLLGCVAALTGGVAPVIAGVFAARGRIEPLLATAACVAGVVVRERIGRGAGIAPLRRVWSLSVRTSLLVLASAGTAWAILQIPTPLWHRPYLGFWLVCLLTTILVFFGEHATTHKGRRLLVSKWRRATRWEFWPPWMFYPPVVAYIVYLMVKHRSLTLFTAANPSIVAGGVVGESKSEILRGLAGAGEAVARFVFIPGLVPTSEKTHIAQRFIEECGLGFPVVLKPDRGQRGSGVLIVRSAEALQLALDRCETDTILQEYISGDEFGIFYYRRPSEPRGHVFSITRKTFPTVVGDGRHSLERLILDDERAVCSATLYCERHRDHLGTVLSPGHVFALAELGSHCRGSVFLDGAPLLTPELEARVDAIASSFDGFYFGRFDVRVPGGADALRRGAGLRVLELNGVTSEATHIYHPGTPLLAAYRVLAEQWRIAFDIGAQNLARGVRPTRLRELVSLMRAYRDEAHQHLTARLS